jgi:hypothetical protein
LQTSKQPQIDQDALKAGIADINDKKISNVQKDTEIKALQAKSPAGLSCYSFLGRKY